MALKDLPDRNLSEAEKAAIQVRKIEARYEADIARAESHRDRALERLIKEHGKAAIADELQSDASEFLDKVSHIEDKAK